MIKFSPSVIFVQFLMLLHLFSSPWHAGTSVATVFNPYVTPSNIPSPLLRPPPSCFPLVIIVISQSYTPLSLTHNCHLATWTKLQKCENVEGIRNSKKIYTLAETVTIHFCRRAWESGEKTSNFSGEKEKVQNTWELRALGLGWFLFLRMDVPILQQLIVLIPLNNLPAALTFLTKWVEMWFVQYSSDGVIMAILSWSSQSLKPFHFFNLLSLK